jgi:hypothetical protein
VNMVADQSGKALFNGGVHYFSNQAAQVRDARLNADPSRNFNSITSAPI